jgi:hypothetical protein
MTGLLDFDGTNKTFFVIHLKHFRFLHLPIVKPMSNDQVHAMSWQYIHVLSLCGVVVVRCVCMCVYVCVCV